MINGKPPINHVAAAGMTASSEVSGSSASNGRVCYNNDQCNQSSHNPSTKKTWQTTKSGKAWETAKTSCASQSGGAGVLGTTANSQEHDRLVTQLRTELK